MMYQQVIARRYARGLLLAANDDELPNIESEFKDFLDLFLGEHQDLYRLLHDPAFSPLERKAVITRIKDASNMSITLYHFLLLLINKARISLLPSIYDAFVQFIDERRGRVRAHIKSATALEPKYISEITSSLAKICQKEVLASATLEPELIGGVRVEMSGLIFDGTVKAKLEALKTKLLNEI